MPWHKHCRWEWPLVQKVALPKKDMTLWTVTRVKYGSKAPSTLRYNKHARIETSTTRRGFNCSLSKKLINLPLNNRMISCHCLDIKVPEVMEQGRMRPKLKMVTPNHIKHKPVGCNASPLIKKFEKHTSLNAADVDDEEAEETEGSGTSGLQQTSCYSDEPHSHSPSEAS